MGHEGFPQQPIVPQEPIKEINSVETASEQHKGLKEIVEEVVEVWKQLEKNEIPELPTDKEVAEKYIETLELLKKGHSPEGKEELFKNVDEYIEKLREVK